LTWIEQTRRTRRWSSQVIELDRDCRGVLFNGRVDGLVVKIKPEVSTVSPQASARDRVTSVDLECEIGTKLTRPPSKNRNAARSESASSSVPRRSFPRPGPAGIVPVHLAYPARLMTMGTPPGHRRNQGRTRRRLTPSFAIRPSFRLPEDDRSTYGINAALIRAVHRARVTGHVIACEKQLGERVVFGGFEFLKQ
jgi:hypothetical protein